MAQRAGIANPVKGLMVFVTNDDSFYYYDGSNWELLGSDDLGEHIATQNIQLNGYRLTNDGGNDDGIRILNNGDVGVGLGSSVLPEARLHVGTSGSSGLAYALRLDNRNNSVGSAVGLQFGKDNNGDGKGAIVYETTAGWGRGSMHFLQNAEVNGNEADLDDKVMTIQNDGKVGIGLSDPATKLEVDGTVTATAFVGNGSGLTNIDGDDLGNHTATQALQLNNNNNISGAATVTANAFAGDGSALTNVPGDDLGNHTATQALQLNNNDISGAATVTASAFAGDGSALTNLPGDDLGNHNATQSLSLNNNNISDAGTVTANFFIGDGSGLTNLPMTTIIADGDDDTKIQVEETADDDIIRFDIDGTEFGYMDGKTFHLGSGLNLFIGRDAGISNDSIQNDQSTFIGVEAGKNNVSGYFNTFVGYQAGENTVSKGSNTFVGWGAGRNKFRCSKHLYGARCRTSD